VQKAGKKIYFATQFLLSMVENNTPLIGEICGLSDSIERGVDGIQLSEETAIGKNPREVLGVVNRVLETYGIKKEKKPLVFWMTGRSGAGKTTIALQVKAALEMRGLDVGLVDGDDFRAFWGNDTGYSREDRVRNLRNIIFTAHQASRSFSVVLVSSLSPYKEIRELARKKLDGFHEVYVSCPQAVCTERDPKGHYSRVKNQVQNTGGKSENFIGLTEDYEAPERPELVIHTDKESVDQSVLQLTQYAFKQLGLAPQASNESRSQ
jgi:adenylylsulfate kinase